MPRHDQVESSSSKNLNSSAPNEPIKSGSSITVSRITSSPLNFSSAVDHQATTFVILSSHSIKVEGFQPFGTCQIPNYAFGDCPNFPDCLRNSSENGMKYLTVFDASMR